MPIRSHILPTLCLFLFATDVAAAPKPARASEAALTIDGVAVGTIGNVDVPFPSSDVVNESAGPSYFAHKHLGPVKYSDVTLTLGPGMTPAMWDWLAATLQMNYMRKNGAISTSERQYEFFNALITEVGFPALETGKRAAVGLSLKFAPEYTRMTKASGAPKKSSAPAMFDTGSFRVEIDGLAAGKIHRVDAFTIKQSMQEDNLGDARDYLKEPGKLEFPNLTFYIPPADAATFYDWHEDFVIKGNCGQDKEKDGRIVLLGNQGNELVEVRLFSLGVFALDEVVLDDKRMVKVDMYVERMELHDLRGPAKEGAAAPGSKGPKKILGKRNAVPGKIPSGKIPKI